MKSNLTDRSKAAELREQWRHQNLRVGYTSGTFDILHAGHVSYLEAARSKVDRLIIGVNSDASVKSYKSPSRPYVPQAERAQLVAALKAADTVFVFDEPNNNTNIKLIKPDIYFKAGDYDKGSLTSAPLIEAYGGEVEILPFVEGVSSSLIADRIINAEVMGRSSSIQLEPGKPRPAAFIDRDGTLIELIDYLHEPDRVKLLPGVLEALKALRDSGYFTVIVTNQPGIGLGFFNKEDFFAVTRRMFIEISKAGGSIDKIYYCPHSASENCECRKPGVALLERAKAELNIDWQRSFFVGDMTSDIECAKRFGLKGVLVRSGNGGTDGLFTPTPDFIANTFSDAVKWGMQSAVKKQKSL